MKLARTILQDDRVVLEPLTLEHVPALEHAAAAGKLWNLWYTSVPAPGGMRAYVEKALAMQAGGNALVFVVRDLSDGAIVGSTRLFGFDAALPRTEIGYTWAAAWPDVRRLLELKLVR